MSPEPADQLLPQAEAERIFRTQIVPQRLAGATAREQPTLAIVAGQPGAGKSTTEIAVREDLGLRDAIGIDADDLRLHHPRYRQLAAADDRSVASHTHRDAQRWVAMARAYVIEQRCDVVLSATLGNPDSAAATIEQFQQAGYDIRVNVVAVHEAQSRLGVLARYQRGRDNDGHGRQVPVEVQAEAYTGVLDTVERIETGQLADEVRVYERDGRNVYRNARDPNGRWQQPPGARQMIEDIRSRPWAPEVVADYRQQAASLGERLPAAMRGDLDAAWRAAEPYLAATPQHDRQPLTDVASDWRSRPHGDVPTSRLPGEIAAADREAVRLSDAAQRHTGRAGRLRDAERAGQGPALHELEQRRAALLARVAAGTQAAEARADAEAGYAASRAAWQQIGHLDAERARTPHPLPGVGAARAEIAARQEQLREAARAAVTAANHHTARAQHLEQTAGGPGAAESAAAELHDLTTDWDRHTAEARRRDVDAAHASDQRAAAHHEQAAASRNRAAELRAEAQLRNAMDPAENRREEAAREAHAQRDIDRDGPSPGR